MMGFRYGSLLRLVSGLQLLLAGGSLGNYRRLVGSIVVLCPLVDRG